eukprot:TRINITY_DN1949_c1_g1_i1.p1 TRINITY_DN1949_c1_g1~~TRINITY_DN1949_c1_g1_i1.p1  ORF type:complete len:303 (+),score=62.87 TRINITY_DN1949_c1_g1_i1:326-1234(+)
MIQNTGIIAANEAAMMMLEDDLSDDFDLTSPSSTTASTIPTNTSTTESVTSSIINKPFNATKNKEILALQYTQGKRYFEITMVSAATTLFIIACLRCSLSFRLETLWVTLTATVLGMAMADFFSGIVHWAADTWGSLETPIFGQSMIRSFREHHLAPVAMTHHDFIEANGDNCMIVVPLLAISVCSPISSADTFHLFLHQFIVIMSLWIALTNQIHKWSHTYKLAWYVKMMQKYRIVITKQDHAVHHRNPFDKYYCITNGWLNPIFASIDFWKKMEAAVTYVSGCVAREDDAFWTGISAKLE